MAVLLAVFFALRALVPQGYMLSPEALADGTLQVVICDGYGTRLASVDRDGRILDEHDRSTRTAQCDFALASLTADLPAAQGEIVEERADGARLLLQRAWLVPTVVQGPPLGSRAPPPVSA